MSADIRVVTDCGTVVCSGGLIVPHLRGEADLELTGSSVSAGHVSAHTHLYAGLTPGGIPGREATGGRFLEWQRSVWWRLGRALTTELLRAAARVYVAEALLAGTTSLIDHHESPERIEGSLDILADACQELGARAVLCYGATERNHGRQEGERGLEECVRFIQANSRPNVRGVIGVHAPFTVSDDLMRLAGDLARTHGTVVHANVAEDVSNVLDAQRRGFAGPIERLIALETLPPGSILGHGTQLTAPQMMMAEQQGLWVVHTPRSDAEKNVGYAHALDETSRVALGSGVHPATMRDEMKAVREGHAVAARRLDAGQQLIGERFGVRVHGELGDVGDLRVLDSVGHVRHVLVGGALVVRDGALVNGQIDTIREEASAAKAHLLRRMSSN
jgi:cytosine/adenosine deaminase-related metal-dependent hydrolase